jgi:site-specific DNA-cytosine methylase
MDTIPQDGATRKPIRVVSLFCGIGASDLGLYAAARDLGIEVEVVDAIDSWPAAVAVYNANLPHPVARVADVKTMTRADLPPHDLVIGGPPCQPFSLAGKRQGHDDPRNCLPDFLRLAGDGPWLMENVISRLVNAPYCVKLNAFDFGDVTTRKRWFYSSHLLHVLETPGPRRFGDIRDHEADATAIGRRQMKNVSVYADADALTSLTAHAWHGHDTRSAAKLVGIVTHRPRTNPQGAEPYATWVDNEGAMGSITSDCAHNTTPRMLLKVGLRGHSASASAFEDDEPLGSLIANSWHGNELSKLGPSVRCPSLLEMARAHSIPDSFDWVGATKTNKGKMIANAWPCMMAKAVCKAMLVAMGAANGIA